MKKNLAIICMLCFFLIGGKTNAQMIEYKYDFNNLASTTTLNGVDNWTTVTNINTPNQAGIPNGDWDIGVASRWGVLSLDNSMHMYQNAGGQNVGRTASRPSTDSLPFDFSVGGVIEVQVNIKRGYWKTFFGFGYDKNNNGKTLLGIENTLQFEDYDGGVGIHLSKGNIQYNVLVLPDGSYVPLNINEDSLRVYWYTYKMTFDLDANNGAGAIALSYKKNGVGNWVNCSSVANMNLGLTPGSGDRKDPAMWKRLFIHGTGQSGIDDIIIRQPNTGGLKYQYLVFNPIADHLTTDPAFTISATSNQGLTPVYSIASGPAIISGNTITLSGTPGIVKVVASQPGDSQTAPAMNDTVSFNVIDPLTVVPEIEILNPVSADDVYSPNLDAILMSVKCNIDFDNLLSIKDVYFTIEGQDINAFPTNNGYYIAYWTPPAVGSYNLTATVVSDFNISSTDAVNFDVVDTSSSNTFKIIDKLYFAQVDGSVDSTIVFPSFSGAYDKVIAKLNYDCPSGGCEPWDLIANTYITGANGQEIQLFSYITPYGVACYDSIDVTDLVSQLQGKVKVRINFPEESVITITLRYYSGTPTYKYSWVDKLWNDKYAFGSFNNLQPVPVTGISLVDSSYGVKVKKAFLREMSSGHGWGDLNTSNAAEFRNSTHVFKINGKIAFTQNLWNKCNPNPSGCMPQDGTWYHDRSGWCPGSIPTLWRFDLNQYIGTGFQLKYIFDTTYVDLCSPYNPNCETGVTCSDCDNMFNPYYCVAGDLITYFDNPPSQINKVWYNVEIGSKQKMKISAYPNPTNGKFKLSSSVIYQESILVQVYHISGKLISQWYWDGNDYIVDLSGTAKGFYLVKVIGKDNIQTKKIIIK